MHPVHIRRALLLFAIVLGLAALAASLSRPAEERRAKEPREPGPPAASPAPAPAAEPPAPLSFDAAEDQARRMPAGQAATVEVSVGEAGSVEIPQLGLNGPADEFTPARFDILPDAPGRYGILFTPAAGGESRSVGTLVVTGAG